MLLLRKKKTKLDRRPPREPPQKNKPTNKTCKVHNLSTSQIYNAHKTAGLSGRREKVARGGSTVHTVIRTHADAHTQREERRAGRNWHVEWVGMRSTAYEDHFSRFWRRQMKRRKFFCFHFFFKSRIRKQSTRDQSLLHPLPDRHT